MIKKLRRRMSLLVIGVLIIVSAGIVLAIYEVNNRNIIRQAEAALDALAENRGRPLPDGRERMNLPGEPFREAGKGTPPPKPDARTDRGRNGTGPPRPEDGPGKDGGRARARMGSRTDPRGEAGARPRRGHEPGGSRQPFQLLYRDPGRGRDRFSPGRATGRSCTARKRCRNSRIRSAPAEKPAAESNLSSSG